MTPEEFTLLLERHELRPKPTGSGKWTALCPAHEDRTPSLSIGTGKAGEVLLKCFSRDCTAQLIAAAVGVELRDLFPDNGGGGVANPTNTRAHVHTPPAGCSIESYAAAKRLPVDFLRSLGITDYVDARWPGLRVMRIPYRDRAGGEPAVRIRCALQKGDQGDDRFLWRKGSKPSLYGLGRFEPGKSVVLVEGESDCHTLWFHGIAALGLPGAGSWKDVRDAEHLAEVTDIYIVIEPDSGGEAVLGWIGRSGIRDRVWLVRLDAHKDPSGLHLDDPDRFRERWQVAVENAEPWGARVAELEDAERSELGLRCEQLARDPDILRRFGRDLRATGIVGEDRTAALIYLACTSRLLPKPISVAIKGASSAGKSFTLERSLDFFPAEAYVVMTAMSERGLVFVDDDMRHRMLVMFEAQGMAGDMQSYLIRSLLSEGRIRYQTTGKGENGEIVGRTIKLEGPTGLLVTTTAVTLHPENETRLLSVTATDTAEQTKAVLFALAQELEGGPDLAPWHALQGWLARGDRRVTIPYARELADAIPPVAVRLRRDFGAVLGLIRAHALLHQASRERDDKGRIIASGEDYKVVRELIVDLVSEGVGRTVRPEVREAVQAVADLAGEAGATRAKIAQLLKLDPSAAGRRLKAAAGAGYVRNLETSRGKPARWVAGDPLPDDVEILPAAESVCTCAREMETPTPSPSPGSTSGLVERAIARYAGELA
jgi:hypothetical protein